MARSEIFRPNPALERGFAAGTPVGFGPGGLDGRAPGVTAASGAMTLEGTVVKTALMLLVLVTSAAFGWVMLAPLVGPNLTVVSVVGFISALVIALVVTRRPQLAATLGTVYAVVMGATLGVVSRFYNSVYDGIVVQALGLTVAITVALLVVYATGLIRPSENFKLGVAAATGGVFLFYMVSLVAGAFGFTMPLVSSNSVFGIGFTLFVVVLAAANLVLDFDFVESGVARGLPRHYEAFAAFGLMVTLVWLYVELLRLLSKLQSRN